MPGSDGKLMRPSIRIGDSVMMLSDEMPGLRLVRSEISQWFVRRRASLGRERGCCFRPSGALACQNHDAARRYVLGRSLRHVEDPFRHQRSIGTHVRDVSPEEMQKAMAHMG